MRFKSAEIKWIFTYPFSSKHLTGRNQIGKILKKKNRYFTYTLANIIGGDLN